MEELRAVLDTNPETPFPVQQALAKIAGIRQALREGVIERNTMPVVRPLEDDGAPLGRSDSNSNSTKHHIDLRFVLEKSQRRTKTETEAIELERRLSAILKEKAEHVLHLFTTRCSGDNLGNWRKDRMQMCHLKPSKNSRLALKQALTWTMLRIPGKGRGWQGLVKYPFSGVLNSDRDTLRPSEEILLKFADFELATGLARKDVPRIARAIEFIQSNYQFIPDDPLTRDQKQDTLRGLESILHEKKILQLRQYPDYHKWFLDLCGEPYSEEMADRVKQCLEEVRCNPNLGDPITRVTPLIALCRRGYSDLVEELLYVDVDAKMAASDGKTALHAICEKRDAKCLARFVATTKYKERNVAHLVNIRDKTGRTPLMLFCRNLVDKDFLSELQKVVHSGCRGEDEFRLTSEEIIGKPADRNGKTVLHHLLSSNQKCTDLKSLRQVIEYLLDNGIHATYSRDVHKLNGIILVCKERYDTGVIQEVLESLKDKERREREKAAIAAAAAPPGNKGGGAGGKGAGKASPGGGSTGNNSPGDLSGPPASPGGGFASLQSQIPVYPPIRPKRRKKRYDEDGNLISPTKDEEDEQELEFDPSKPSATEEAAMQDLLIKDDTGRNPVEWVRHWGKLSQWKKWSETVESLLMEYGHPKEWSVELRRVGLRGDKLPFKDPKFAVILDYEELRNEQIVEMLQPLEATECDSDSEIPDVESEAGGAGKDGSRSGEDQDSEDGAEEVEKDGAGPRAEGRGAPSNSNDQQTTTAGAEEGEGAKAGSRGESVVGPKAGAPGDPDGGAAAADGDKKSAASGAADKKEKEKGKVDKKGGKQDKGKDKKGDKKKEIVRKDSTGSARDGSSEVGSPKAAPIVPQIVEEEIEVFL
eukprot:g769.t1